MTSHLKKYTRILEKRVRVINRAATDTDRMVYTFEDFKFVLDAAAKVICMNQLATREVALEGVRMKGMQTHKKLFEALSSGDLRVLGIEDKVTEEKLNPRSNKKKPNK